MEIDSEVIADVEDQPARPPFQDTQQSEQNTAYFSGNDAEEEDDEEDVFDEEEENDEEMPQSAAQLSQQQEEAESEEDESARVDHIDDEGEDEDDGDDNDYPDETAQADLQQILAQLATGQGDDNLLELLQRYVTEGRVRLATTSARRNYLPEHLQTWAQLFCEAWQRVFEGASLDDLRTATGVFGPLVDEQATGRSKNIADAFLTLYQRRQQIARGKPFSFMFPNRQGGSSRTLSCRNSSDRDVRLVFTLLDEWIPPSITSQVAQIVYNDLVLNERLRDVGMMTAVEAALRFVGVDPRVDVGDGTTPYPQNTSMYSIFADVRDYLEKKRTMEEDYKVRLRVDPSAQPPMLESFDSYLMEKKQERRKTSFTREELETVKNKGSTIAKVLFAYIFFMEESNQSRLVAVLQALMASHVSMQYHDLVVFAFFLLSSSTDILRANPAALQWIQNMMARRLSKLASPLL